VPTEFWNWGYNCCFFLIFVPLHIESPYNLFPISDIVGKVCMRIMEEMNHRTRIYQSLSTTWQL
jgi:hypothetical protein